MRRVLIAGGSRGIGAALVRKFTSIGDTVAFIYNSSDESAESLSKETGALMLKYDLATPSGCKNAVEDAISSLGTIDVLITSCGIASIKQICDTTDEEYQKIIETNLSSAFRLSRDVSREMVKNHTGKIITIGSVWGRCGASCEVAYSASKSGLRGLTMSLAKELAPSGITVNCVEPGVIDTDMNACLSVDDKNSLCNEIPVGRFGKTEEVASLVAFLASSDADYITAQCIGINGGFAE